MKAYFRVYAFMLLVDVALMGLISWMATIPLTTLFTFAPLAGVMFLVVAFFSYKLNLRGVWWLVFSLIACDVFISLQFFILNGGRMNIVSVFTELHRNRLTFFLALLPEIVAHVVGLFAWRFVGRAVRQ